LINKNNEETKNKESLLWYGRQPRPL